jgi:carboxymethylenebutenolidase
LADLKLPQYETYLIHEFVEDYEDGLMSRRDMVRRVILLAGGVAGAATALTTLGVRPLSRAAAAAQQATPNPSAAPRSPVSVRADDPRIQGREISFLAQDGATIMAYQVLPLAGAASPVAVDEAALPLVLICHENRGLQEHIRDVARRWAVEGYLACAVDLLSREGGTASITDPAEIPALLTRDVDPERHVADFQAAVEHFRTEPRADMDRVGMTGFCFGGGITWRAATRIRELQAAAPYYGPPPPLDQVPSIETAVLGVYSDDPNDFANDGRDDLVAALEAAGATYEIKIYPNTQHAFHNDTGERYNEAAALQAWSDTLAWFARYVKEA